MKAVKRWRYYCDHCKKVGGQRFHMAAHESACTLNPQRKCNLCTHLTGAWGESLPAMLALLPDPKQFITKQSEDIGEFGGVVSWDEHDDEAMRAAVNALLPKLREMSGDCPVCILAALRQKGIPVPVVTDFNFTEEMKAAREVMNENRNANADYY